ncbi:unnamed protein product [Meloidogyne enterolobii]|uniref:Uncharacterized protein n=1 Tax=Meloidogyne enterolobii TaxID=390850 RepID=A0ACB1AJU8_MELEN
MSKRDNKCISTFFVEDVWNTVRRCIIGIFELRYCIEDYLWVDGNCFDCWYLRMA